MKTSSFSLSSTCRSVDSSSHKMGILMGSDCLDFPQSLLSLNLQHQQVGATLPVTMLISSSWLRWLDPSDRLELAELNGCSDGHGDGGPTIPSRVRVRRSIIVAEDVIIVVMPPLPMQWLFVPTLGQPSPDLRRGLYLGGPRNGTETDQQHAQRSTDNQSLWRITG